MLHVTVSMTCKHSILWAASTAAKGAIAVLIIMAASETKDWVAADIYIWGLGFNI